MSKILVAYFSASGNTKGKAIKLAQDLQADLFTIEPVIKYTSADLDWRNEQSRSSIEMKNLASRPAIVARTLDLAKYDDVYLGFPIWWYTAPTIINTFLESYDFRHVTIHLFMTSGSSKIDQAFMDLKKQYPQLKFTL